MSIVAQQPTASYRRQQARAVPATIERRPTHGRTSVSASPPPPSHGASAAAGLAASHRALRASVLSIEGARTYVPGIIAGAVAVFVRFSSSIPARPARARAADRGGAARGGAGG